MDINMQKYNLIFLHLESIVRIDWSFEHCNGRSVIDLRLSVIANEDNELCISHFCIL